MTPTPDVTTADSDTLTVQQLDELEGLNLPPRAQSHALGGGVQRALEAFPALLATVRRQQAALDAVTELADRWDELAGENADLAERSTPGSLARERRNAFCYLDELHARALRTALASPAPTEATT